MKRFFALLLVCMMASGLFAVHSSAADFSGINFLDGILKSQEGGDDPDIPNIPDTPDVPEEPEDPLPGAPEVSEDPELPGEGGEELPEDPQPGQAKPVSPQTGYGIGIAGLSAVAAASGAVAVIAGKKASRSN